jgi:hypothetical protein
MGFLERKKLLSQGNGGIGQKSRSDNRKLYGRGGNTSRFANLKAGFF